MKRILIAILIALFVVVGGAFAYTNRHQIEQDVLSYGVPQEVAFNEIDTAMVVDVVESEDLADVELDVVVVDSTAPMDAVVDAGEDLVAVQEDPTVDAGEDLEVSPEPMAEVPIAYNLAIPFTSQAPLSNWNLPYQESCEEASVLMAIAFFDNALVDISTADKADAEILKVVEFQKAEYGEYQDTNADETAIFGRALYPDYEFTVVHDPSVDDIKRAVASGSPVLVPAAGRKLGNPNFSGDGPLYHMLVIKGYTETSFVTNDPGTRNGNSYVYKISTVMNAMGDWNDGDPANGAKVVIVVSKK